MPDFIIIGAQKAGTSSLFAYLAQHPQLVPSFAKEVHYYDGGTKGGVDNFARGPAWYAAQFPPKGPGQKSFEASPLYLFHPLAPGRIASNEPDTKLIVLLRNPTERAVSHYFHETDKDREPLGMLDAMKREEARLAPPLKAGDYNHKDYRWFSYKARGRYAEQLERYLALFRRSQLLVLGAEDFFVRPAETLKQVFEFVGVDPGVPIPDLAPRNVARNRSKVDASVYTYLDEYFEPHNRRLYELLGRDFGWQAQA